MKKYQLVTLKSWLYNSSARVLKDEKYINIEFINMREERDIEGIWRLCEYFNTRSWWVRPTRVSGAGKPAY